MESSNYITENKIDFILSGNSGIVQDGEMLSKIRSNNHKIDGLKVRLNLKRERRKFRKSKKPSMKPLSESTQDFKITLQNILALLNDKNDESVDRLNDKLTTQSQN